MMTNCGATEIAASASKGMTLRASLRGYEIIMKIVRFVRKNMLRERFTYHKLSTRVPFTPLVHHFHSVRQILIELNYGCGDIVVIVIMMCVCTIICSYC
jgi:hypothetical protein